MTQRKIDLAYALTLPPEKAVAYFRSKGRRVSLDWHSMWKEAHAAAFTVANCAKLDVLRDLQLAIRKMLKEGKGERWFVQTLEPVLRKKGWWGPRDEVNPRTGEIIRVQQGSRWRLGLIARQNVQNAVNAGRWQEQWDNREEQPWLRYVSLNDARTRPDHRALHDRVFPIDDPFWTTHYPPNGWGCRCHAEGVSPARLKRRGWKPESSEGRMITREIRIRDRRTGEVAVRAVTGFEHERGVVWTDAGFDYNPGAAAMADNLLRESLRGLKDPALYEQVRQAVNNSRARQEGFAAAVREWQKDGLRRGRNAVLGILPWRELIHARTAGADTSGIVVFNDEGLLHSNRTAHHNAGIAAPQYMYPQLAELFARPEGVFWDKEGKELIYVFRDSDPEWCIFMPLQHPVGNKKTRRRLGDHDAVASIYRSRRQNLKKLKRVS